MPFVGLCINNEKLKEWKHFTDSVNLILERGKEDADDLGGELDYIHTPKVKLWHILVIILILVLIVVSIYGYFHWQLRIIENEIKIKNSVEIKSYFSQVIRNLRGGI